MNNFEESLDKFIAQASKRNKIEPETFVPWKMKLLEVLGAKVDVIFRSEDAPYHSFLSKAGLEELKKIHSDMVVTYADKSSHDFVLCCKFVYKRLLWEELHSDHYVPEMRTNEDLWKDHAILSEMVARPAINAHRYLYGILKMHKKSSRSALDCREPYAGYRRA